MKVYYIRKRHDTCDGDYISEVEPDPGTMEYDEPVDGVERSGVECITIYDADVERAKNTLFWAYRVCDPAKAAAIVRDYFDRV